MYNVIMTHDDLYRLIWLSRPLMQAAETSVERGLSGTGLTVRMRAILEILHVHGDATVPELAAQLEIKRQYVQLMVNETLEAGLISKRMNPRHKNSALLTLTERGAALIEAVVAREQDLVRQIGADLDAADVGVALDIVQKLIARLKQAAGSGP